MAPLEEIEDLTRTETSADEAEMERLRAENAVLRDRLGAAEIIVRERGERIQDLLAALRGLPETWASPNGTPGRQHSVIEVPAATAGERPARSLQPPSAPPAKPAESAELGAAEDAWAEVRRLRNRLEWERLERELERLRFGRRGARLGRRRLGEAD